MDRILENYKVVGTCGVFVYTDGTDYFKDSKLSVPMTSDEIKSAYLKGCVIAKASANKPGAFDYAKPSGLEWKDDSTVVMTTGSSAGNSAGGGTKLYKHVVTGTDVYGNNTYVIETIDTYSGQYVASNCMDKMVESIEKKIILDNMKISILYIDWTSCAYYADGEIQGAMFEDFTFVSDTVTEL